MKLRRIASLTALLTFAFLFFSSIILYVIPYGRWSYQTMCGLESSQWIDLHINIGILFLVAIFFHIYYNWKPIKNYWKDKKKKLIIFTKDFNMALLVFVVFCVGTYYEVPPFSVMTDLSKDIKQSAPHEQGKLDGDFVKGDQNRQLNKGEQNKQLNKGENKKQLHKGEKHKQLNKGAGNKQTGDSQNHLNEGTQNKQQNDRHLEQGTKGKKQGNNREDNSDELKEGAGNRQLNKGSGEQNKGGKNKELNKGQKGKQKNKSTRNRGDLNDPNK